jgi:hypothetical protein
MAAKYARICGSRLLGSLLQSIPVKATKRTMSNISPKTSVYVLQLSGGMVYVGQSSNVEERIKQHLEGRGAAFTRRHKPTGIRLTRLGNIDGAGDSGERQEVLLQMRKRGMAFVRGWKYCNNTLSASDIADVKSNWVEMFNLCRKCMAPGHMASSCNHQKTKKPNLRPTKCAKKPPKSSPQDKSPS